MDKKFEAMDAKFEARFEEMDKKFEAMDAKFEARFEEMDKKFEARFNRIEADIKEMKIDIRTLSADVNTLFDVTRSITNKHDQRITTIEKQLKIV